jgi:hypothetical protein
MRQICSRLGATAIDPKLLTEGERLRYERDLLAAASLSLTRDPGAFLAGLRSFAFGAVGAGFGLATGFAQIACGVLAVCLQCWLADDIKSSS